MTNKFTPEDIERLLEPELANITRDYQAIDELLEQIQDQKLKEKLNQELDNLLSHIDVTLVPAAFKLGLRFGANPAEMFDLAA